MLVNLNRDESERIKKQIEDKIVDLQVEVRLLSDGYEIRMGDGYTCAMTIVDQRNPYMVGWDERLTRIVHELIQRYTSERYLKK